MGIHRSEPLFSARNSRLPRIPNGKYVLSEKKKHPCVIAGVRHSVLVPT